MYKVYLAGRVKGRKWSIHKQRRNRAIFNSDAPDELKNTRLYKEVRYAWLTSTSLKPTAAVFRLKRNHKKLESQEYYDNLTSYLSNVRSIKTLTLSDLKNVLHCLANKNAAPDNSEIETSIYQSDFVLVEHVIAFWLTPIELSSVI